ncbi:methionyl-tRNA formyltransferase [Acetivibrio ethanolgignens]|uniref:Methionyl-tRNA formyltransferase n=1 Tax=Acetivibrio ethanolgignens TaxID=290052 RepID=A0A0V8QDY6_9FIRM|nr:methionyl-tRNA formyltransferase [Acetivibrio ethanolgignens]KSV58684.1 methionyl-tRNA formyltransferase [Acetivibrio ethanolgignens]
MKVIFMGTPDFAVPTLRAIHEAGHELLAVVTQPDKPKGRGEKIKFPPVKEQALEYGVPVYQPVRIKREPEFIELLRSLQPEVIVVVAFGQILPKEVLDIPKYGCINVHASLLPKLRGAAPIQWSVINGEEKTGVTTMFMDVGLDTGDMLLKEETPILPKETGGSLHDRLAQMGGPLLVRTLEELEKGSLVREKQRDEDSSYARMLDKALGQLDFSKPAIELERLIRGLNPWPSAYTHLDGKTMKIWKAEVVPEDSGRKPGEICRVTKKAIAVQTGSGALEITELQLEGKKRMSAEAFLRGYEINEGTLLQ